MRVTNCGRPGGGGGKIYRGNFKGLEIAFVNTVAKRLTRRDPIRGSHVRDQVALSPTLRITTRVVR